MTYHLQTLRRWYILVPPEWHPKGLIQVERVYPEFRKHLLGAQNRYHTHTHPENNDLYQTQEIISRNRY